MAGYQHEGTPLAGFLAKEGYVALALDMARMEPRLNIVTLGVENLERAIRFYHGGLGRPMARESAGDFAVFKPPQGN